MSHPSIVWVIQHAHTHTSYKVLWLPLRIGHGWPSLGTRFLVQNPRTPPTLLLVERARLHPRDFILPFLNSQQCDAWVKTTSLSTNRYNADGQYSLSETSALHSGSNITHGYCMNDYGFKVTRLSLPRSLWLLSFFVEEGKGRRKGEKKGKRKTVVPPIASIKLRQIQTHSYPLPIAPVRCNGRIFAVVGL